MYERNIILTGFMGTGKSSVGKRLAEQLGRPFVDTDAEIIRRAGMTIPRIFELSGEAGFRRWERRVCRFFAAQDGFVIATGGGMLVDVGNRAVMIASGFVFCLNATPETILARLQADATERPMLKRADWRELLDKRRPAYREIPHQIYTDGKTPEQLAEEIIKIWQNASR